MENPSREISNRRTLQLAALCALAAFLAYAPSLFNGFVGIWDDRYYVVENAHIRSLDLPFLKWAFTSIFLFNWHPLTIISYAVDYAVWGLDPFGYHLTNTVLHAADTFLVFVLTSRLIARLDGAPLSSRGALTAAAVSAAAFGLHPMHVESVAWVSERKDVLFTFFYILSVLAYLRYAGSGKAGGYVLSLLLSGAALMSKPMAVSVPAVLLILDLCLLRREKELKKVVLEKVPYAAMAVFSGYATVLAQNEVAVVELTRLPLSDRVPIALHGYVFYLLKLLLPVNLSPYYPILPAHTDLFGATFIASAIVLASVTAFTLYMLGKGRRNYAAVWLFYLVTLLPVIGIVQVGGQSAADRYVYLPSIGPMVLAGFGAGLLYDRVNRVFALALVVSLVAALSYATVRQAAVWKDPLTLWGKAIEIYPEGFVARHFLAKEHQSAGRADEAVAEFRRLTLIDPGAISPHHNLGLIFYSSGMPKEARAEFEKVLERSPGNADARYNIALIMMDDGKWKEAIDALERAVESGTGPTALRARNALAISYARTGDLARAREELRMASALDPTDAETLGNLKAIRGLEMNPTP